MKALRHIMGGEAQPLTPQNFNLFEANIYLPAGNKNPLVMVTFWQWLCKDSVHVPGKWGLQQHKNLGGVWLHNVWRRHQIFAQQGGDGSGVFEIRWGQEKVSHQNSSALSHSHLSEREQFSMCCSLHPPLCALCRSWGCWALGFLPPNPRRDRKPRGDSPALLRGDPSIICVIILTSPKIKQKYSSLRPSWSSWGWYLEWKTGRVYC